MLNFVKNESGAGSFAFLIFIIMAMIGIIIYGSLSVAYTEISTNMSTDIGVNESHPYYQDPDSFSVYAKMIWGFVLLIIAVTGAMWFKIQVQAEG